MAGDPVAPRGLKRLTHLPKIYKWSNKPLLVCQFYPASDGHHSQEKFQRHAHVNNVHQARSGDAQCYNSVDKLAKTQNAATMQDTGRFSEAVFAYLLGQQFDTFCENLNVIIKSENF